jgi:DMSO/TMAO reductase YedYZ molybdopterin-dependent catalytic subunit
MAKWRYVIAGVVVAAVVASVFIYVGVRDNSAPTEKVTVGGTTHEVTPTAKLGVRTAEGQPTIDLSTYRLKVKGLVKSPLSLSFDDIKAMPAAERFVKLPCVEGWTDRAVWKGPRLADVLKKAGVKDTANTVVFKSPGGYTTSLRVADVMATDPMLAYVVNGDRLPDEQGYPLRLVVPNRLGYKWIKWVVEIDLIKGSYQGYWESRGYSNDADATGR